MSLFFNNKKVVKKTREERIDLLIKEYAGLYYMSLEDPDIEIDSKDLDMFYDKGWEIVSIGFFYGSTYIFKRMVEK
jgi:hypothetical protein